ncbi:transposase-like protein [Paraburkholderia tropica]|uniref:Transposase-like protein n=1 Tax=Paraburkholderia tropica TaxID=92647 RepID=A0ABX5MBZ8_9BURK|nr:transposase-like protein [Paraburkholderia tropica]MBB6323519.1 transposase-like protein [Paraburkholderia tropica]PXX05280.1 transposase-like protein [Paraburkholderia tropica]PZW70599.1 transposase-like protein [Paraburkholderia tropica]
MTSFKPTQIVESIEVLTEPERRRLRSVRERVAIVQETLEPGATVSAVARRHGVNPNQVFVWRKQYEDGSLAAVKAGEAVVPASQLAAAMKEIRELQRLLGKKTQEAEILKEVVEYYCPPCAFSASSYPLLQQSPHGSPAFASTPARTDNWTYRAPYEGHEEVTIDRTIGSSSGRTQMEQSSTRLHVVLKQDYLIRKFTKKNAGHSGRHKSRYLGAKRERQRNLPRMCRSSRSMGRRQFPNRIAQYKTKYNRISNCNPQPKANLFTNLTSSSSICASHIQRE